MMLSGNVCCSDKSCFYVRARVLPYEPIGVLGVSPRDRIIVYSIQSSPQKIHHSSDLKIKQDLVFNHITTISDEILMSAIVQPWPWTTVYAVYAFASLLCTQEWYSHHCARCVRICIAAMHARVVQPPLCTLCTHLHRCHAMMYSWRDWFNVCKITKTEADNQTYIQ